MLLDVLVEDGEEDDRAGGEEDVIHLEVDLRERTRPIAAESRAVLVAGGGGGARGALPCVKRGLAPQRGERVKKYMENMVDIFL